MTGPKLQRKCDVCGILTAHRWDGLPVRQHMKNAKHLAAVEASGKVDPREGSAAPKPPKRIVGEGRATE